MLLCLKKFFKKSSCGGLDSPKANDLAALPSNSKAKTFLSYSA
uniref:Uncharacterized protein n=1 Tax=Inoviridae sp. ctJfE44 TaxID=2825779 RepID=A0A8S5UBK8_9VIRU|nr:MAG TPA: hypothetical protein [Inoviridae sp. ctJfE44]